MRTVPLVPPIPPSSTWTGLEVSPSLPAAVWRLRPYETLWAPLTTIPQFPATEVLPAAVGSSRASGAASSTVQRFTVGTVRWQATFYADTTYMSTRMSSAPITIFVVIALFTLTVLIGGSSMH